MQSYYQKLRILFFYFFLFILVSACRKESEINIFPYEKKMQWFNEAKFGMFIHWGVYSGMAGKYVGPTINGKEYTESDPFTTTWGGEWILYQAGIPRKIYKKEATKFTAANFNAQEIVNLAVNTGMKYIIITAKHHEGFLLYPSQVQPDWSTSMSGANGRDVLKELVDAAKNEGLKIGFYFSQNWDWMQDGSFGTVPEINYQEYAREDKQKYVEHTCRVISEIMNRYGKELDIFWWDIPKINTDNEFTTMLHEALTKHPNYHESMLQNDRLSASWPGDFATPEGSIVRIPNRPYELCTTLNSSWGYNEYASSTKTYLEVLHEVLNVLSKGGNMLLNISPRGDGSIALEAKSMLDRIGDYVNKNKESLYGSESSGFKYGQDFGRITRKGKTLYLHHYFGNKVQLYGINDSITRAETISGRALHYTKIENGYEFDNLAQEEVGCITFESIKIEEGIPLSSQGETTLNALSALDEGVLSINGFENNLVNYNSWTNLYSDLSWMLLAKEDMKKYDVFASISCLQETMVEVSMNKKEYIYCNCPSTKGYDVYKELKIGSITIPKGFNRIVFKRTGGSPLNFNKLRLVAQ